MNRIIKNKPSLLTCEICNKKCSAYSLASHIKHIHNLSSDEYELKHGKFRKEKIIKRTANKITCQLCKNEYSTIGLNVHLRDTHSTTIDDYVDTFGEFRVNILNKKEEDTELCLLCNSGILFTSKGLTWHLKEVHNIAKIEYVKTHILEGKHLLCECGCGQEVSVATYKPYIIRKFIIGHNSVGENNNRYQQSFSTSTREKMKIKALERVQAYKDNNEAFPICRPEVIQARIDAGVKKMHERFCTEYNIRILDCVRTEAETFYKLECLVCSTTFEQYHEWYFYCPVCHPKYKSKVEEEIVNYIKTLDPNTSIIRNSRTILGSGKELDIYLPEYNLAIEFNGLYWHGELRGKDKNYHISKTINCETKGITLLHIFEDEWINYKLVVLDKIAQKMNKFFGTKIMARKCTIGILSFKETANFLNEHHLQGTDNSGIRLGLYHKVDLVAVMTFSKPSISKGGMAPTVGVYELNRFCVKRGVLVVGAAGKLFSYFIKNYNPNQVFSYADRRWSTVRAFYDKIGFKLVSETLPGYWYVKPGIMKRYHRFNFTKQKTIKMGGDPNSTEWANMQKFGFDRIWDCGHIKFQWDGQLNTP